MNHSTPLKQHPKKETLDFIRAFARSYQPERDEETADDDVTEPMSAFQAFC